MNPSVFVFDPTVSDKQSKVRGVGRYIQILKENFSSEFVFTNKIENLKLKIKNSVFINPFFNLLSPPLLMKRVAKKQIAVIHDLIPLKYPKYFPIGIKGKLNVFLNKLSLKNYDSFITDSEASRRDIVKILGFPKDKVYVVYPCLPKIFAQEMESKKWKMKKNSQFSIINSPFCLYVGDATWNKNLVNLAKAIKIMNVTCVFVGKVFEKNPKSKTQNPNHPWQKEYKEFLEEINNDKRFILKGFVSDKELAQLYQQARVNVLPSRDEGFGFSYLEASSQKCPSVLADIPVLHEISDDAALFVNPNDPHDIANAIGELYWSNRKRNEIGLKAYERGKSFSSSQFKKSFRKLIEKL